MNKRVLAVALTACILLGAAAPARADGSVATSNVNDQTYSNWDAAPVGSFLCENSLGGVTRVEHMGSVALVEEYDGEYTLQKSLRLSMELPVWGGFFAGKDYNFFVFGQSNPVESDSVEVLRVVKYSKDWERLGSASLRGANTSVPFYCGSLRMTEDSGMLYIRTSHQMYTSTSQGGQANMTVAVRERDMTVTDSAHLVADVGCGYVSHSFNQFILTDSRGRIVALDQGDNFPARRAVISVFAAGAGSETVTSGSVTSLTLLAFPSGGSDYRVTGCSLGGFGETENKYMAAYSYDGAGVSASAAGRSVYLASVDKETFEVTATCLSTPGVSTPQLVTGEDGGYILWNDTDSAGSPTACLRWASFDENGAASAVRSADGALSDCAPILMGGKAVWYVTDGGEPVFYELSDSGLRRVRAAGDFPDVQKGDVMYEAVSWSYENGVLSPDSETDFGRTTPSPRSQVVTALWRAMGSPEPETETMPFTDVAPGDPCFEAVLWAYENEIAKGNSATTFGPEETVTRRDAITFLYRAAGASVPGNTKNPFEDIPAGEYYTAPVLWAARQGITNGVTPTTFAPDAPVTKSELAAFLYRWTSL